MRAIRIAVAVFVAFAALTAAGVTTVAGASPAVTSAVHSTGHPVNWAYIFRHLPPGYFDLPAVVPGSTSQAEGTGGFTDMNIPVVLSKASSVTVTVDYHTFYAFGPHGHQAIPLLDYTRTQGTVTFAPGETSKTVSVRIRGDRFPEHDEFFALEFNHPQNARMGGYWGLGFGTIVNDDGLCPVQL